MGWFTAPGSVWQKHADNWSKEFRCIIPDNRGVGLSDKPAGAYSTEQMADDHAGLLGALAIESARVVGCSMGSTIAQQLALRHPQLVRSIVLMCTWARCDRYARDVFRHMSDIKSRLRPEEFATYIQLLIFAKPYWDQDAGFAELLQGRKDAASNSLPQPSAPTPGADPFHSQTLAGLHYHSNLLTPYWNPEAGFAVASLNDLEAIARDLLDLHGEGFAQERIVLDAQNRAGLNKHTSGENGTVGPATLSRKSPR